MHELKKLGWNSTFQQLHDRYLKLNRTQAWTLMPARVTAEHRGGHYTVLGAQGELSVRTPGRWLHHKPNREAWPAVGDWVEVQIPEQPGSPGMIHHVLTRQSSLLRRAAGERTEAQVLGANLDLVFIVVAAGGDFSPRRVERYLVTIRESGARPAIILSKIDLVEDHWPLVSRLEQVARGAPVLPISGVRPGGLL
ncbi:MAG: GTPase RsgA, partial [Myxococcota bacterium]